MFNRDLPCSAPFRAGPEDLFRFSLLITAPAYPGLAAFSWSLGYCVTLCVCLTDSDFHEIKKEFNMGNLIHR